MENGKPVPRNVRLLNRRRFTQCAGPWTGLRRTGATGFGFECADFADQFAVAFGRLGPIHQGEDTVASRLVDVSVAGLAGELHHGEGDQRITVAEFQQAVRLVNDHIEHDHRRAMPTDG